MRALYGTVKMLTFAWVLFMQPLPRLAPVRWAPWAGVASLIAQVPIYSSGALCIVLGVPFVVEFMYRERPVLRLRAGRDEARQGARAGYARWWPRASSGPVIRFRSIFASSTVSTTLLRMESLG